MSKHDQLLTRLLSKPANFSYNDLVTLLSHFGYSLDNKGRTSGSRVKFYHPDTKHIIMLHRPHPQNYLKQYQIREIISALKEHGLID